jgi:cyanophycinase-like exopeptidase
MSARLALIGGEEFSEGFEAVHAGLLADLGGRNRRVVFLPTASADDGAETVERWCTLAREKLSALGAVVETPRVVDPASANDEGNAQRVAEADWVYLGGGYAHVAQRILRGTRVLAALQAAKARGALITGASAGAMWMGAQSIVITPELLTEIGRIWDAPRGAPPDWDPPVPPLIEGLGWLPQSVCAPHFDRPWFAQRWLERGLLPNGFTLIGVDEQTVLVTATPCGAWEVRGRGAVAIIGGDRKPRRFTAGERVTL